MLDGEQSDLIEVEEVRRPDGRLRIQASRVVAVVPWRSTFREFLVIVAGVLSALAAQTVWTRHQDHEMERDYLRQLLTDTRENEQRVSSAIDQERRIQSAARNVMTALEGTGPLPPTDSMTTWMVTTAGASDFRPLVGTYRALLGTGDLRLIHNDTLRALLTEYSAQVESESTRLSQLLAAVIAQAGPLGRAIPYIRRVFIDHEPKLDSREIARLRDSPDAAIVVFTLQAANNNRLNGLRAVYDETTRLRKALEAEPALHVGH
jgi:hypothetical protein